MKQPKFVVASVVMSPRLREALDRAARGEQRSRAAQIRVLLERALAPSAQHAESPIKEK